MGQNQIHTILQQITEAYYAGQRKRREQLLSELAHTECPFDIGDWIEIGAVIGEIREILHGEALQFQKRVSGIPDCHFWIKVATLQHGIRFFPDNLVLSRCHQIAKVD